VATYESSENVPALNLGNGESASIWVQVPSRSWLEMRVA
jgi:hypothetical protein